MTDPSSEAHELPFYDGKVFRVVSATDNSQTTAETRFHYHQCGAALWGEYAGGGIALGRLIGRVAADGAIGR